VGNILANTFVNAALSLGEGHFDFNRIVREDKCALLQKGKMVSKGLPQEKF